MCQSVHASFSLSVHLSVQPSCVATVLLLDPALVILFQNSQIYTGLPSDIYRLISVKLGVMICTFDLYV